MGRLVNPMGKECIISSSRVVSRRNKARLEWNFELNGESKTIFVEVDKKYKQFLVNDVCDALIFVLFPYCLYHGVNIVSRVPVSENFLYKIQSILIPELLQSIEEYHPISIDVDTIEQMNTGLAVGTGASGGIDSTCSVVNNIRTQYPFHEITHLVNFQYTPFNKTPSFPHQVSNQMARDYGLPLVNICSNVIDVVGHDGTLSWLHYYYFSLLSIRRMFRYYYFSSTYHYSEFDSVGFQKGSTPDCLEMLLAELATTPGFEVIADCHYKGRLDKVNSIIKSGIRDIYTISPCGIPNCGWCPKCIRTLVAMDLTDSLDKFRIFDIEGYKSNRDIIFSYVFINKDDIFLAPLFNALRKKGLFDKYLDKISEIHNIDELREIAIERHTGSAHYSLALKYHKGKRYDLAAEHFKKSLDCGFESRRAYFVLSHYYRDGTGCERNLDLAIDYMSKAIRCGVGIDDVRMEQCELFDLLIMKGTDEAKLRAFKLISEIADDNHGAIQARIGRCFLRGIGVEVDLDRARRHLSQAYLFDVDRAGIELVDVLWKIGTEEAYSEAFSVAQELAAEGDSGAMLRLGRAYRDGKGTEQNLPMAVDNLRGASKKIAWVKNELFDVLWKIGTEEAYSEAFSVAQELAAEGDSGAMLRLGRAYRDGKGIRVDYSQALSWLKEAAIKGSRDAINECYDLVWNHETVGSDCAEQQPLVFDDSGIIVFNLTHTGYLWELIALRYTYHSSNKHCVLLVGDLSKRTEFIDSLVEHGIFSSVIDYNCWPLMGKKDFDEVDAGLRVFFDQLLKKNGITLSAITQVYTSGDIVNSFAVYLSMMEKCYVTVSWAPNEMFRLGRYYWGSKYALPDYYLPLPFYILQKRYGVLCQENSVMPVLFSTEDDAEKIKLRDNYSVVNYHEMLESLSPDSKERLSQCIPDRDKIKNAKVVVLPSSLNPSTEYYRKDKYPHVYQLFVDLYLHSSSDFVIKSHPTNAHFLDGHFPVDNVINGEFPIQLLSVLSDCNIQTLCGVHTGGIRDSNIGQYKFEVGLDYFKLIGDILKIYSINQVAADLGAKSENIDCDYSDDCVFITTLFDKCTTIKSERVDEKFYLGLHAACKKKVDCSITYHDDCPTDVVGSGVCLLSVEVRKQDDSSLCDEFRGYIRVQFDGKSCLKDYKFVRELRYSKSILTIKTVGGT